MTSTWDPVFAVQSRADVAQGLMDQPSCTSNHVAPMLADRGRAGRGGGASGEDRGGRGEVERTPAWFDCVSRVVRAGMLICVYHSWS